MPGLKLCVVPWLYAWSDDTKQISPMTLKTYLIAWNQVYLMVFPIPDSLLLDAFRCGFLQGYLICKKMHPPRTLP